MGPNAVSRSVGCASIRRSGKRCCASWVRWASKRRCRRSRTVSRPRARCCVKRSWLSKRLASRRNEPVVSTMPWTRTTASWPGSWNGDGMSAWRWSGSVRRPWRRCWQAESTRRSDRMNGKSISRSVAIWSGRGTTSGRPRRAASALCERCSSRWSPNIEGDRIRLRLHWQGGDHTELTVRKNRTGRHRWTTDAETGDLVRELARLMPDRSMASLLNRLGKRTGKGNPWTEARVRGFRTTHGIAVYRDGERQERNELTLQEAAERLGVSKMTVLRQIQRGTIPARQACKGAPWVISVDALEHALSAEELPRLGPVTGGARQQTLEI